MTETWTPVDNIELEKDAYNAAISKKNILVYAGPGAGKTELLAQKACYIFQTKKLSDKRKILAISFKKDAASNLHNRVFKRCPFIDSLDFQSITYDAFCKRLLDQFIMSIPKKFQPTSDYAINNDIKDIAISFYEDMTNKTLSKNGKNEIQTLLERKKINELGEIGIKTWHKLLNYGPSQLSFQMITLLVIYLLENNPLIVKALQYTYQYVFLDEFQDTNTRQYELIKLIFCGSDSTLTAVGDEKQRIMLWAGADQQIFKKYLSDFCALDYTLLFNHRSAPCLINMQKKMYSVLNEPVCDITYSKKWNEKDGKIYLVEFDDEEKESDILVKIILKKIESGIKPKDICILTKQLPNNYAYKVMEKLKFRNIESRIENDYQDLVKENVIVLILSIFKLMFDIIDSTAWNTISEFFDDTMNSAFDTNQMEKFDQKLKMIKDKFVDSKEKKIEILVDDVLNLLNIDKIKGKFREYQQGLYFTDIINKFKNLFEINDKKIDMKNSINNFIGENSIPIMTIHKSKGLEYNIVIFMGLEDSAFWNFKTQPEEDKCAFFVALSRAKEEIIFTFSKSRLKSKYPKRLQKHDDINELFELLKNSEEVYHKIY